MLGTIGDSQRMDGTVFSDAVNLAARIEGLTKIYGASLMVSDSCFNKLSPDNDFGYRDLGRVQVKGKGEALNLFELFDGDNPDISHLKRESSVSFADALNNYYQRDFEASAHLFKQILKANPADQSAALYHQRSAKHMIEGVDDDWQGIEVMRHK